MITKNVQKAMEQLRKKINRRLEELGGDCHAEIRPYDPQGWIYVWSSDNVYDLMLGPADELLATLIAVPDEPTGESAGNELSWLMMDLPWKIEGCKSEFDVAALWPAELQQQDGEMILIETNCGTRWVVGTLVDALDRFYDEYNNHDDADNDIFFVKKEDALATA